MLARGLGQSQWSQNVPSRGGRPARRGAGTEPPCSPSAGHWVLPSEGRRDRVEWHQITGHNGLAVPEVASVDDLLLDLRRGDTGAAAAQQCPAWLGHPKRQEWMERERHAAPSSHPVPGTSGRTGLPLPRSPLPVLVLGTSWSASALGDPAPVAVVRMTVPETEARASPPSTAVVKFSSFIYFHRLPVTTGPGAGRLSCWGCRHLTAPIRSCPPWREGGDQAGAVWSQGGRPGCPGSAQLRDEQKHPLLWASVASPGSRSQTPCDLQKRK